MNEPAGVCMSFLSAVVLAAVFLLGSLRLREDEGAGARSFAGGIALAYVFLHLLPELSAYEAGLLEGDMQRAWIWFEEHVYVFSLAGVLLFYLLHGLVGSRRRKEGGGAGFRLEIGAFGLYSLVTGYLLATEEGPLRATLLITVAFGAHLWSVGRELSEQYGRRYRCRGAPVLSGAVIGGWMTGSLFELPAQLFVAGFSFLAGGVILNTFRNELPRERAANFAALFAGVAAYALVILLFYRHTRLPVP